MCIIHVTQRRNVGFPLNFFFFPFNGKSPNLTKINYQNYYLNLLHNCISTLEIK